MVRQMLLSENAAMTMSPARISFSYDLPCQSDVVSHHHQPSSATTDFDFCVRKSSDQDSSSADELFSGGKILATEIKKKRPPLTREKSQKSKSPLPFPPAAILDEAVAEETEVSKKQSTEEETEEKQSKSFWGFKRSSSLNCGSGYGPSLCPLPLLSRSNSTGSATSVKRTPLSKDNVKQKPSSSMNYQKPPLKKSYGSQGNGVRINPVLNVPAVNIFGLASIFSSNGRDKNKNTKK